jgi:glycosyltransferase involved in cell wall biosynthesis
VVIPTFNRAAFVADAIRSCLAQGFSSAELEIIVVDDGSTDDTVTVLKEFAGEIVYLPFPANRGRNIARNAGLAHASGRYVKFLDSDDVLESGSLRIELLAAKDASADIVVSGCRTVEIRADRSERQIARFEPPNMEPLIDSLLAGKAVATSAALYSRALISSVRWDEALRKLDDWDLFVRAALRAQKIARADVIAYSWRQHSGQGIRSETMLQNALEHHVILAKMENALAERGMLTKARRERLAQYFYKEMRVLCLWDKAAFERGVRHIHELDPAFVPRDEERQWWMRSLCRILGVRRALSLHTSIKRFIKSGVGIST